ncbi:ROK family glucokinase [Umezawaea endophytica]|uniref:Glucokinase n=1 Tax=Umezawaea endophytica TaxID=1654476 RepID=A0A9X2VH39_9PSEU|nr:ROK family glucokinase [Umezawaea endophytica]MCS7476523.1 ROK family glucokinase [Umezawaea endophytica]
MLTVGVDIGGTSVRAGVVNADGAVIDITRALTPGEEGPLEDAITTAVAELATRHHISAVGLAVAGFVATDRRTVRFAPHLAWRQAPVAQRLSRRTGLPVVLEHDANAAALAEHRFGASRGAKIAVMVALGTGIGGALLIDGKVYRGAHGVAPELGHLRLVPDGRPCPCGKNGCWERYCSGTALSTTAVELLAKNPGVSTVLVREALHDSRAITGRRVAAAARDGDPLALRAMADLAKWLGDGLALVADVYDPEMVVIGGGVSESAPLFLDDARERYAETITGAGHRPLARIRTAQLGDDAGLVGAATLARDLASHTTPNGRKR